MKTKKQAVSRSKPSAAHHNKHAVKRTLRANRSWSARLVLHPTSAFMFLLMGVFLVALTFRAAADTYAVHAVVAATPLKEGAVIQSPVSGLTVSDKPLNISGYCPNDAYVKLFRNGMFSGVAICQDNRFEITTDLFAGRNELQAQAFNITDSPGPRTASIDINYMSPHSAGASAARYVPPLILSDVAYDPGQHPLLVKTDYEFKVVRNPNAYTQQLQVLAGTPPYAVQLNWGDGRSSELVRTTDEPFAIEHTYVASGQYPVWATITDAAGKEVSLQLAAFIRQSGEQVATGNLAAPGNGSTHAGAPASSFNWLQYAWPTYAVVGIMVLSFWLGERREYLKLTAHIGSRRIHHG